MRYRVTAAIANGRVQARPRRCGVGVASPRGGQWFGRSFQNGSPFRGSRMPHGAVMPGDFGPLPILWPAPEREAACHVLHSASVSSVSRCTSRSEPKRPRDPPGFVAPGASHDAGLTPVQTSGTSPHGSGKAKGRPIFRERKRAKRFPSAIHAAGIERIDELRRKSPRYPAPMADNPPILTGHLPAIPCSMRKAISSFCRPGNLSGSAA